MNSDSLLKGNISKLIFKLSIPMIIAQLINLLYNIVDRIFIGHYENGEVAIGGVGACFPIIIIISAFSALFGMGGAPLAALKLGEKDIEGANKILNNSFKLLFIIGIIILPFLYLLKEPILYAFGANDVNIVYANEYLNIYTIGTLFVMFSLGLNQYISCQGKTIYAMISVVIGALLNIALDPIFIYVFHMGVSGAALATIISQLVSSIFVICVLCSKKSIIKINVFKYKLDWSIIKKIAFLGLSPFIMQSTEALVQICFNSQIKNYISDINLQTLYLSSMTIIISIMSLLNMPLQGLAQGTQPIISQNYGAGLVERSKEASRKLIIICLVFSFCFVSLIMSMPGFFASIFNDDEQIIEISKRLIRLTFIGMAFMGIQIACQNSFLALGKSKISLFLAILRKIVLLIPLMFIIPLFLGTDGIFISESVADILAIFITFICYSILFNKYLLNKNENN